jgi:hypothetical protein
LNVGIVAVREGEDLGMAFVVSDYYGKTSLIFSELETSEPVKAEVAEAFWNLLLSQPDELADVKIRFLHTGAGAWMSYGCEDGEPYCNDLNEFDEGP